jgi:hypothetical protein
MLGLRPTSIHFMIGWIYHAKMSHNESSAKSQSHVADCGATSAAVHPSAPEFLYMAWSLLSFLPQDTTPTESTPYAVDLRSPSLPFARASRVCKDPSKKSTHASLQLLKRRSSHAVVPLVPARPASACRNAVKGLLNIHRG